MTAWGSLLLFTNPKNTWGLEDPHLNPAIL